MDRIGERSLDCYERGCFGAIFDTEAILVPVPRSRPLKDERALWPARRIAEELASRGLGCDVRACLERREPIEKSALQRVGAKRPLPEDHLRTIRVVDVMFVSASRVVLVDDVVTRGATLLACATLLSRAFPSTAVSAFAAVRTMSGPGREIEGMLAPVTGVITYANGRLHREP